MLRQMEGSQAVAQAVALCRPEVVCAYGRLGNTDVAQYARGRPNIRLIEVAQKACFKGDRGCGKVIRIDFVRIAVAHETKFYGFVVREGFVIIEMIFGDVRQDLDVKIHVTDAFLIDPLRRDFHDEMSAALIQVGLHERLNVLPFGGGKIPVSGIQSAQNKGTMSRCLKDFTN